MTAQRLDETPAAEGLPRLELEPWSQSGLTAGITTRAGDFNLGLTTGAPADAVTAHWRTLFRMFRPAFSTFHLGLQIHGAEVAVHGPGAPGWVIRDGVDGHVTRETGVLLLVTVADCVPVFLTTADGTGVALLHAGWRGVAAGVLEAGLDRLAAAASCTARDVVMHCGPSICGSCYEVGPEVIAAVEGRRPTGPEHLDLRAVLAERARGLGVARVTVSGWCTAHDRDRLYSHRASGGTDGRMVAFLGRPTP